MGLLKAWRFSVLVLVVVTACSDGDQRDLGDAGHVKDASRSDAGSASSDFLDRPLPFEVDRKAAGEKAKPGEVAAFTSDITGFWKHIGFFDWLGRVSHGLDASYDPKMPDFALWFHDFRAVKKSDTVTYRHVGGADNLTIGLGKHVVNTAAAYLASGDPRMGELLVGWSKGVVALFRGASWDGQDPPVENIMVRALFTHDHGYTLPGGRKVFVDYSPMRGVECASHEDCPGEHTDCPRDDQPSDGFTGGCCRSGVCTIMHWHAHTVPNPDNPFYGDIWIRNMRSKDDVPHIFRMVPWLRRLVAHAPDAEVREHARDALDHLVGFAASIVDEGYKILTIEDGRVYVPEEDLASFTRYDAIAPTGECNPKLIAALVGYGKPLGNDCGSGLHTDFESIGTSINYYNYEIVRFFHLTAIANALATGEEDAARVLLDGLVERVEIMEADEVTPTTNPEWDSDVATFLLAAAANGLPLTEKEAELIRAEYTAAIAHYEAWAGWDLWDVSVPDGEYPNEPPHKEAPASDTDTPRAYVSAEELAYLLEYCASPWRSGAQVADCDVVLDPARWGE